MTEHHANAARFTVAIAAAALTLISCGGEDKTTAIERGDLNDDWPFTVDQVTLACPGPGDIVTVEANGTVYALNGLAKQTGQYANLDSIWADDPDVDGLKISMEAATEQALALCEDGAE